MTLTVGQAFDRVFGSDAPVRVVAWDGSEGGSPDGLVLRLTQSARRSTISLTAPGELGLARAYLLGDLVIDGMDEATRYDVLRLMSEGLTARRPSGHDAVELARFLARHGPHPPTLPPEETPGQLRRHGPGPAARPGRATPPRSATTTTCRTPSTSWSSARR